MTTLIAAGLRVCPSAGGIRWSRSLLLSTLICGVLSATSRVSAQSNTAVPPVGGEFFAPPIVVGEGTFQTQVVDEAPAPLTFPESRLGTRQGGGPLSYDPVAREREARYVLDRIDPHLQLEVPLGRPVILRLRQPPFRDQVADPETLDVLNITQTEYSITGRQIGTTVLNFWFEHPEIAGQQEVLSYLIRVVDDVEETERYRVRLTRLEDEINRNFPNSSVRLSYVGRQVVVRGQARDVEEATQILRIVAFSLPRSQQDPQAFDPQEVLAGRTDEQGIILTDFDPDVLAEAGGLQGFLSGNRPTGVNSARINNRIVNLLEVGGLHQVMLKVTVAEVNRTAVRAIGADLRIGGGSGTSFFSLLPLAQLGVAGPGGTLLVNRGDFDLAINALKELNLARSLAEPNLVTLNGQPANFFVGGEFPVPQITGFTGPGLQGVEFVPFGVQLSFLPNVTEGDRIRLNLQATVSARNAEIGTTIGGTDSNVAGLNSRNFQTTVELREGQTLAIAGLLRSGLDGKSTRVPFLGDIPYFGRLFSSDTTSYDEQELIVLVTPYLVNPLDTYCETPPLPGSDYFEPDDLEFFLRGSLTGHIVEDFRTPARTDLHQMKAFRRLEQELIIGHPGHANGLFCPSVTLPPHR